MILGVGIGNIAESLADALITVGGIVLFAFKIIREEPDPQAKYC